MIFDFFFFTIFSLIRISMQQKKSWTRDLENILKKKKKLSSWFVKKNQI